VSVFILTIFIIHILVHNVAIFEPISTKIVILIERLPKMKFPYSYNFHGNEMLLNFKPFQHTT